jgi:transposase
MMGQPYHSESLFYYFRIEDHVPENHLLRLIDRYVNRKRVVIPSCPTGPD